MTDPSRFRPRDAREEFDADSLSWLAGELRSAAGRFRRAIQEAVRQDGAEAMASLREARAEVRLTESAVRIVDVPGLSVIIGALDELLERIETRRLPLFAGMAPVCEQAMDALVAYLDARLGGAAAQPLRLFPAYRALLDAMGAERIAASDLFFPPDDPPFAGDEAVPRETLMPEALMRMRRRFEEALLRTLKSPSPEAAREHIRAMRQIIADIGRAQDEPRGRAFWRIMEAFADAAEAGSLSLDARQIFAQLNLRLRRMSQGSQGQAAGDDDRLKREALLQIALSPAESPALARVRDAYSLREQVPPDFSGWVRDAGDADALPRARRQLAQAKALWERHVGGEAGVGTALPEAMQAAGAAAESLNLPSLAGLLSAMADVARQAGHVRPWDELGLEMETGLLFGENALADTQALPEDFSSRAAAMAARLRELAAAVAAAPEGNEPPATDAVRDVGALIGELDAGLRHIERMLEEYFRDPAQPVALHRLDLVLGQVEGNLVLLDQPEAVRALRHARETVRRFMSGIEAGADAAERERLARNLDTLDELVTSLRHDAGGAKERYQFDDSRGLFEAAPREQAAPASDEAPTPPDVTDIIHTADSADVPVLEEKLEAAPAPAAPESVPVSAHHEPPMPAGEADDAMMPLFLHEARERLAELGHALQSWREQPSNSAWGQALLRQIHTLKGSARMAGAATLGKHLHDMEGQVADGMERTLSAEDLDTLADFHDRSLALFDELRQAGRNDAVPLVRVRADLLERLSRQAAKAGLLNAKLDAGLDSLRQTVGMLAQELAALRLDLREMDGHVTAQMSARLSIAGNREFDAAEFDRLSRLQELARLFGRGIDQAGALQQAMTQTLDNSAVDLAMQARLTTDMQHNLTRARRARLSGIADRLQRVVRHTAKETGKSVRLALHGGAVELDRDLLDRLPAPLEHLLRNAIVHGIETPGDRRAAGKEATGELTLEAWQEGRDTVIRVADDGRGLNLHRIRRKGMQLGLLSEDAALSDEETQALIFHPGFSTADELTPWAGRGMGLDAARADIEKLGGRLAVHSETGKGVQFVIRLPGSPEGKSALVAPRVEAAAEADDRPAVMVVDDSHSVRRTVQRLLARAGYRVLAVKDGREALDSLRGEAPAVMLIDAEMPHLDGFGLLRAMREDARLKDIPVIMISSRTTVRHRDDAAALGVRAYLGKPYREEELLSLVAELTGRSPA